jgi:hypothetical protein
MELTTLGNATDAELQAKWERLQRDMGSTADEVKDRRKRRIDEEWPGFKQLPYRIGVLIKKGDGCFYADPNVKDLARRRMKSVGPPPLWLT